MTVELDVAMLTRVVGVLIPILVAVVTKKVASRTTKALVNAALSALAGALATVIEADGALHVADFVNSMFMTWVVSVAAYYGFYDPTGITNAVHTKTDRVVGVGGKGDDSGEVVIAGEA